MHRLARVSPTSTLLLVVVSLLASCAKEREPRSYLQPNIIKKTDLTGEWYYTPTVVDVGYGTSVTFIGEVGWEIHIIEWDIQENVLYARLAYDRVRNTESVYGGVDDVAYAGEPIGAWAIEHFDVIRDYNATTGEETNVLKESKERPWYTREFIRVDWSENLISNWNLMWERAVSFDPVNYQETDPDHPHAPHYERGTNGNLQYIGVTAKLLVSPQLRQLDYVDWYGLTALPDCYFYGTTTSCTSTEVVVRHAFAKRDPDHEYHPREYTQREQEDFGYFLTQRLNYNREYGVTVGGIKFYANVFNLYEAWYEKARSPARATLHSGGRPIRCPDDGGPCRFTDEQGGKVFIKARVARVSADLPPGLGAGEAFCRCDAGGPTCEEACFYVADGTPVHVEDADGTEKLLLRPHQRPLKPVVYFLTGNWPESIVPVARQTAAQWADVLNRTVWLAAGCPPADYGVRSCANRPEFDDPAFSMLVLCENAVVQEGDPPECGPPNTYDEATGRLTGGRRVQLGDLRFSQLVWIDAPHQDSPLGYGPPLADPRTGETISAVANIYGAELDRYSRYAMELARIMTDDDFPWADYLWSPYQVRHVRQSLAGGRNRTRRAASSNKVGDIPARHTPSWSTRTYRREDIAKLYRQMNRSFTQAVPGSTQGRSPQQVRLKVKAWLEQRRAAIRQSGVLGNGTNPQQARINQLRDSFYEDVMMTPDYLLSKANTLRTAGYDPVTVSGAALPPGSDIRRRVSPLTRLSLNYLRALNKVKGQHYARTVMYPEMVPFSEPSVAGISAELVCTYCCANPGADGTCAGVDTCRADSAEQTARWAADAQCQDKVFRRIRDLVFDAVALHEMGHNMGLRHNFKGTYDSMNYFDDYWRIRKLDGTIGPRTTDPPTAEEYAEKITQYQYSSIMDYGGKFNSDVNGLGRYDVAATHFGYSNLRQVFTEAQDAAGLGTVQSFRNFYWPTAVYLYFAGPEAINYTQYHYDAAVNPGGLVDTNESNRAWVPARWIVTDSSLGEDVLMTDRSLEALRPGGQVRVMVPYQFCSDEYANLSLGCNVYDEGPDLFEITENQITSYESHYVFNNFGRDRYEFGWDEDAYPSRILYRYFEVMRNHMFDYVYFFTLFHDWGLWTPDQVESFFVDPDTGWGAFTASVARTFETFSRVLFVPQPGCYLQRERPDATDFWYMDFGPPYCAPNDPDYDFFVDFIDGKHWDDDWDFDFGYQWDLRQTRIGQFYDRPLAIQMLSEATNNFLGRDTQEDYRKYTINYARIFPQHINVLFQAIQSGNLDLMAPTYCGSDAQGNAIVEHRDIMNLDAPRCALVGGTDQGRIDPGDTFTTQLNAAALGMAMFPLNYSQEFVDKHRVYVEGGAEGIDFNNLPAGVALVRFQDPFSFKTYLALRYPDVQLDPGGASYSPAIGAAMLDTAQRIKDLYEFWRTEATNNPGDVNAQNQLGVFRERLQNWIENLEMARGLTYLYEHAGGQPN